MVASARGSEVSTSDDHAGVMVRHRTIVLFLVALGIRWAYALITLAFAGLEGLKLGDSHGYLVMAEGIAKAMVAGRVGGWGWLGPDLSLMPLFTWSLTAHVAVAGTWAALTYVLAQGVLDAGTCVAVFGIAWTIDRRIAVWAGYAAAVTPTLVVLSGIVYTDTAFVFFATLSLFGAVRFLHAPLWRWALVTGLGIGCAALMRVWIVPWAAPLLLFLAVASLLRRRFAAKQGLQLVTVAAILALCVAPVLLRNNSLYGVWSFTPQSGTHMAMWIAPLVREAKDGTPRSKTVAVMEARFAERFGAEASRDPFVQSARYRALAEEELGQLGFGALAKAWLYGAAINLASPAVTVVPTVATLPRTGFYDTPGRDFVEKVTNFLFRSENALYAWLLVAGIAGVVCFRLIQFAGALTLLFQKQSVWPFLLLLGWVGYVLIINGPIASPKYRLPLEPGLAVLAGAALARIGNRRST